MVERLTGAPPVSDVLPLRWRLPNAPVMFVGRDAELEHLKTLIARAPITIVWGLGGLGKTALVLRALHEPTRVTPITGRAPRPRDHQPAGPPTVFVSLRAAGASSRLAVEVTRALCAAERISSVDWPALLADDEALDQTAIDLAEREGYRVIIDDLHHGEQASTEALLRAVARYARRSRWVATSRIDWPVPEIDGQRLALGGMSDGDLTELARQSGHAFETTQLAGVVRGAAGSPWRLRMALMRGPSASADDVLADLSSDELSIIDVLGAVMLPLPRPVIIRAAGDVSADAWARLERRGLIEPRASGWRLHDMARALIGMRVVAAAVAVRIGEALRASDEPLAWIEALRLLCARQERDAALALIEARGEALLENGYAPELWSLLEPMNDRRFAWWRLRAGVDLGSKDVFALLREPPDPTPAERVLWAHALFVSGHMQASADVASRALVAAIAAQDVKGAMDAELLFLHAQALASLADRGQMLQLLGQATEGRDAQRTALAAKIYALIGVYEPSFQMSAKVLPEIAELSASGRLMAYLDLLAAALSLGRMADADDMLARIEANCGEVSFALYNSRYLEILRISVTTHRGRFADAHAIFSRILSFSGRTSPVQRTIVISLLMWLQLAEGELTGMDAQLDFVNHELAVAGNEYFQQWGAVLRSLYDRWHGRPPETTDGPRTTGAGGNLLRIYRLIHATRHGAALEAGDRSFLASLFGGSYFRALARVVPAIEALLAGDSELALRELRLGLTALIELGNALYASEVREVLCDVLLVTGRRDELAREVAALAEQARAFPSPRLLAVVDLLRMGLDGVDPAALERLAHAAQAPIVSRRARVLLGGEAALDRIDQLAVDALRRISPTLVPIRAVEGWRAGWGLDGRRQSVWLPGGRSVPLADTPLLWSLLESIAQLGGEGSRDALVPLVYPGESYDPRVHNNRLAPAVRKLRLLIEDDAAVPTRLVTTRDGYGFGASEPVRWLR